MEQKSEAARRRKTKGDFTLPGEAGYEKLTLRLAKKWGADVVRDSDGTQLSPEILSAGYGVYSTICVIREHNDFAKAHPETQAEAPLYSLPVAAESETLEINLLNGYFSQQFEIDERECSQKYWQAFDRTENKELPREEWTYLGGGKALIKHAKKYHEYSVNFFAFRIWEEISMYNHITNGWQKEHLRQLDPVHPVVRGYLKDYLRRWCAAHPATNVVRFTSLFYNFVWIWGSDKNNRFLFTDWASYDFTASPAMLENYEKSTGGKISAEDFINGGKRRSTHTLSDETKRKYMRFVQNFVADFAAELVQIVHDAGKKAYMFYDDSWVGSEPYSESFARIGFDGIIKCVFSAYEARMCADVPGVETHELRLHPYLFPTGLTGEPVFAAGGDPVTPAKQYWTAVRRALLRRCADRIGLGGYLHLTQNFPDFCDYIETLADEFRKIKALHKGGAPYALPVKISVLTHWGKLRSWTCGGHYHEHPDLDLINLLESVAGLPVQTEFIDFAQLKNGDFTGNVLLVAGLKNSAYGGGSEWNDVKTYESAAKFVHGGGALICVNEASETDGFSTNLRLAPLLGVDLDRGDFNCRGKYPAAAEREEISVGTFTGKKEAFIFAPDVRILKNAEARAGEEKTFAVAARNVGKGFATYVSSYKHTPENAAALLSLLLRLRNLSAAGNYLSDNPYVDCAYFEKEKKLALANVSGVSQAARISLPGGGKTFTLPPAGIKIVPVGKIRAEEKEE